jgi:hypothetical protein
MITICEEEGLTQAQFIETLLERELSERGVLDADFTFLNVFSLMLRLLIVLVNSWLATP